MKGKDKIKIYAALSVVAVLVLVLAAVMKKHESKKAETREGLEKLAQLESLKVADVEKEIQEKLDKRRQLAEEKAQRTPNQKMENSVIAGDSRTEGFLEFEVLDASRVTAKKGIHLDETEGHIYEIVSRNPQNIFLAYGLNDLEDPEVDEAWFREHYKKVLDSLQEKLPESRIYVLSMIPVQAKAVAKTPEYANLNSFNQVLKKLCEKEKVTYIDMASAAKAEDYEPDGIHFRIDFYRRLVDKLAEVAEL